MKYFKKLWALFYKSTPKGTIMWIQVPMSTDSQGDKDDIIIATINQLEQNIKIK